MNVKKITAVLLVEEVVPCIKFWVDRLGFDKIAEVPEGDKIVFAILQKNGTEIMYQTYASVEREDPIAGPMARKGPTFLFVEVADLAQTKAAMEGVEVTMEEHATFYGSREFTVRDPAGHFVTFAQF